MPPRVFLDSNVFLFGFERPRSNSHRILELLSEARVRGLVTDRVVREVMRYFRKHYGKDLATKFREFILLTCDLLLEADLEFPETLVQLVGRKDAGAVAASRALGLRTLVSADRDFEGVPERRTPREFLLEFGERARPEDE